MLLFMGLRNVVKEYLSMKKLEHDIKEVTSVITNTGSSFKSNFKEASSCSC